MFEYIEKIVNIYKNCVEIEKYFYKVIIEEIVENDFNLNIFCYVDIFEEEEEIDIKVVMKEIKMFEVKRSELDR